MSGPAGPRPQKVMQESRVLVQTHLLTSSLQPPPREGAGNTGSKAPLRLPSLVAAGRGSRGRSSMARLSLSEPSLLNLNENIQFEGFSNVRRPSVLQKRPPPPPPPPPSKSPSLLPCRTWLPSGSCQNLQDRQKGPGCSRPVYFHFSQAIQPRSRPARHHSYNPTPSADNLRPLGMHDSSPQREPLSVVGKPYLRSCSQRLAPAAAAASAPAPARAQLHVFLPTEAEAEEVDSESVDEGFMDELDCKMTSLKLQQGALKTLTYH
ncbi:uncharacterized protein LOC133972794 [Platichthys flesus]|uniref:uncharacterized protein LOC133972794 n=1 Tax=Platichthys flesus TaxID=8260 RepID=UPI002DBE5D20|nr:uncharacterized protein LOC133972794 [Platichthys flesus]